MAVRTSAAYVIHRSPGRLRLKVAALRANPEMAERIAERLSTLPGVIEVRATPATRSVLVLHEEERFSEEQLAAAAREAELFELSPVAPVDTTQEPARPRGATIWAAWESANRGLRHLSHGLLDLRTLIPLALVLWAFRQILTERPLVRTPWYTLLWYAFGIFTRFCPPPK